MNIAFGFDIFYPETNGVITTTINLAKNLIDMGHKVYFFVPYNKNFKDDVIENGIRIVRVKALPSYIYRGMREIPVYGWFLFRYLVKYKIDIVHNTTPWKMGRSLNHAARRLHIPTIATHHTLIDNPIYIKYAMKTELLTYVAKYGIWPIVFNPFYKLTWIATAPSISTCDQIKSKVENLDVRYVSNGIDISSFEESAMNRPLPSAIDPSWLTDKTLVYVGRLGFEKAIDVTVKAFSLAVKDNPEAQLIIIGRGPAETMLKEEISKLSLDKNIHMTGMIPNKEIIGSGLLKRATAFVTASLSENQAITVIEALCSGAPVICADVDNMTCLVGPEQGWYFKGGDVEDLASKMNLALNDRESRDAKAREAIKSKDLYDGRNVAKQFEGIYKELLKMKAEGFYVAKGQEKVAHYMTDENIKRSEYKNKKEEIKEERKREKEKRKLSGAF